MGAEHGPEAGVSEAPTQPGDVIGGKYRIEGLVAEGHRCQVMAATHLGLREIVAVKVPVPGASFEEARARFAREARLCGRMRGAHLPRVHDVTAEGSAVPYLVLEYLEGQTLAAWLDDCGVLPMQRAVGTVLQACEALAELHAAGMVHGAVQPGKLLLTTGADQTPSVKILGLADATPAGEPRAELEAPTSSGTFALRFGVLAPRPAPPRRPLAPEARAGAPLDARADVWGLGATLHELLVGAAPPDATETAPSLRARRKEIPEALEALVGRALSPNAAERHGDVAQLAMALVPFGPPVEASAAAARTRRLLAVSAESDATDTTPEEPLRPSDMPTKPSMSRADLLRPMVASTTEPALFGEHLATLPLIREVPARAAGTGADTGTDAEAEAEALARAQADTVPEPGVQSRSGASPTSRAGAAEGDGRQERDTLRPALVDSLGPIAASALPPSQAQPAPSDWRVAALAEGWTPRRQRAAAGAASVVAVAMGVLLLAAGAGDPSLHARTAGWHALAGVAPIAAAARETQRVPQLEDLAAAGAVGMREDPTPTPAPTPVKVTEAPKGTAAAKGKAPPKPVSKAPPKAQGKATPKAAPRSDADLFTSRK